MYCVQIEHFFLNAAIIFRHLFDLNDGWLVQAFLWTNTRCNKNV